MEHWYPEGRSNGVVEAISRRNIDICCVQEVRWRGESARLIEGKYTIYKLFRVDNYQGSNGVGIFLAEKWIMKVFDIRRVSERILLLKLILGEEILTVIYVCSSNRS